MEVTANTKPTSGTSSKEETRVADVHRTLLSLHKLCPVGTNPILARVTTLESSH